MKTNNKQANVLIYSLVLVNLSLLLALAMFNNFFVFLSNTERGNMDKKLSANILYKGELFAKYARTLNANGSGIINNIGCPATVNMSGNTLAGSSPTNLEYLNGSMYCMGDYFSESFYLIFNPEFTGFSGAIYQGDALNLSSGVGARPFVDSDSTLIDINPGLPTVPDEFDDNFNSDNYNISASGSLNYPGGYVDDDAAARTLIYGYISPDAQYSSILWSNDRITNYIDNNPNNDDIVYEKLGSLSSGILYLDADRDFDLKILQFNKNSYNSTKELIVESKIETKNIPASIGYIQNNGGTLSLSGAVTGNEYTFDFTTKDYAVFLNNIGSGVLTYVLTGYNASGSGVYINAINDSGAGSIKYLGAEMIQDTQGNYIGKIFETAHKK